MGSAIVKVVGPNNLLFFCNEIISTVFSVVILQGCCEKYQKVPNTRASCMCDFEASARPINFLTLLRHTPCYLLEVGIDANLKCQVPVENIQT